MHAFLLAVTLAVGSGDGRDGATDGRTTPERPDLHLRVGMTPAEVARFLGNKSFEIRAVNRQGKNQQVSDDECGRTAFCAEPDWLGSRKTVLTYWDREGRLARWTVLALIPSCE
jgi:hypothetical protein